MVQRIEAANDGVFADVMVYISCNPPPVEQAPQRTLYCVPESAIF
jgi:hypothetical protein